MSVSTSTAKVQYTLSSGAQALPVTFYFLENGHVQALVERSGEPLILVENTDYTLTGAGNPSGGTLTTIAGTAAALVATDVVTIRRNIAITQLVNYVYNDNFPADTHERALDKLTMICQYLDEMAARALRYPATEPAGFDATIPAVSLRANGVFRFAADGDADVVSYQQLIDDLSIGSPTVTLGTAGKAIMALETIATMKLLGRTTAGSGNAELVSITAAGLAILQAATPTAQGGLIGYDVQRSVVTTQFDKTDTTLANVSGLSATVTAAGTYEIEAVVNATVTTGGNGKVAIGGTATATAVFAQVLQQSTSAVQVLAVTALGSAVQIGNGSVTSTFAWIKGTIVVNAGGTLTLQFAQQAASGTSSVLVGSRFTVSKIS